MNLALGRIDVTILLRVLAPLQIAICGMFLIWGEGQSNAGWGFAIIALIGAIQLASAEFGIMRPLRRIIDRTSHLAPEHRADDGQPLPGKSVGNPLTRLADTLTNLGTTTDLAFRQSQMLENIPTAVMFCDAHDDFRIRYANKQTFKLLKGIEHELPIKADALLDHTIDVFHRRPEHQRKMLADASNLPHRARIRLGAETLDLFVTALHDRDGTYLGPMVTWSIITQQERLADTFELSVKDVAQAVSSASNELQSTADSMAGTARATSERATIAAAAADQLTRNVGMVAGASEQLSASIQEIGRQVTASADVANDAVDESARASKLVGSLAETVNQIGSVVELISGIAAQTNLLALNATIEAARAGEAGKGFAVVAGEVKALAGQTARATDEIGRQIAAIQSATETAVGAIRAGDAAVHRISDIATAISAAVEEQAAATREIAANVQEAAISTQEVTRNIFAVSDAAEETGSAAGELLNAAGSLARDGARLRTEVDRFLLSVRTG